jgi:hypothetical protein
LFGAEFTRVYAQRYCRPKTAHSLLQADMGAFSAAGMKLAMSRDWNGHLHMLGKLHAVGCIVAKSGFWQRQ